MKLKVLFTFCFLLSGIIYGQQNPDAFMFNQQVNGPAIIPQSPEVARLGRYGELPLNTSTGQMNFSLPIHSIQVDGNSWPISLNYNYGGLIVEEKQSLFGLGWNLSATGTISREVRGLPDEAKYGYYSRLPIMDDSGRWPKDLVDQYMEFENDGDNSTRGFDAWNLQTMYNLLNGVYDSEPDKYTVTVGSLNFSFKLNDVVYDSDNKNLISSCGVYMLSKHSNKVEVIWSSSAGNTTPDTDNDSPHNSFITGFMVTDTNGTKYTFDVLGKVQPQGNYPELEARPITSWKLSQIEFLNGQKIRFNYSSEIIDDYSYSNSAVQTRGVFTVNENPNGLDPNNTYNPENLQTGYSKYFESIKYGQVERQVLNTITFPKGRIEFTYQFDRKLCTGIDLYSTLIENPVKTFGLQYHGPRDLLKEFSTNAESKYQMEYYFEDRMPPFINSIQDKPLARKRDLWKFYNGANNRWGLNLPDTNIDGVDKSPNAGHTKIGALKRIIYPTKGSSNIYYELNEIKTQNILDTDYYQNLPPSKKFHLELDASKSEGTVKSRAIEILYPSVVQINHRIEGNKSLGGISIDMGRADGKLYYDIFCEKSRLPRFPGTQNYYDVAPFIRDKKTEYNCSNTIPEMYPSLTEEFGYADTDNGNNETIEVIEKSSSGKVLMMPGIYNIEIFTATPGAPVKAEITLQFFGSIFEPHPSAVNKKVGGIRIDYVKDCSGGSSEDCFITDYDYNDGNGLSTGRLYLQPQITRDYSITVKNPVDHNGGSQYRLDFISYFESPYTLYEPGMGSPVYYSSVKTQRKNSSPNSGSDPLGSTRMFYTIPRENFLTEPYPKRPMERDLDKGQNYRTEVFKKDAEEPHSVTSMGTAQIRGYIDLDEGYDLDDDHPWGLKVFIKKDRFVNFEEHDYKLSNLNPPIGSPLDLSIKELHDVLPYRELNSRYLIGSKTDFSDGVSKKASFGYNDDYMVNKEVTTDSRGNETIKKLNYANEAGLNEMVAINQLGTPITTETTYNGKVINRTKTDFLLNANGYKPTKTYVAKGDGDLEAKMKISYDQKGRVIQVDQLSDTPTDGEEDQGEVILKSTSYLWGYNGEFPVVKAVNATYAQITGTSADLTKLKSHSSSLNVKKGELSTLRTALPNALIMGYTYKPLIGIENTVDSRGYTTSYEYENLNRLNKVKDENGKMQMEYLYAFRSEDYRAPDDEDYPDLGGTVNGPDNVGLGEIHTYTVNPTGGSGDFSYSWYQDGSFLESNVTELDITFDSGSSSTIGVMVTDNITGDNIELTMNVAVTTTLAISDIVASAAHFLINSPITFLAPTIEGGGDDKTYRWLINGSSVSYSTTLEDLTYSQFGAARDYQVQLEVTDNDFDITEYSNPVTVTAHNPFAAFDLNGPTKVERGDSHGFWADEITGGSGSEHRTYQWFDNGAPIGTGTSISHSFNSLGNHTISFVVRDTRIEPVHDRTVTMEVTVYEKLSRPTISVLNDHVLINKPVTFTAGNISGGSPNQIYKWYLNNDEVSAAENQTTYTTTLPIGQNEITFKVEDVGLSVYESASQTVTVYEPITIGQVYQRVNNESVDLTIVGNQIRFIASFISGGSGAANQSGQWYIDGSPQNGETSTIMDRNLPAGDYSVTYRRTDALINNASGGDYFVEKSTSISVYEDLVVNGITVDPDSPITVNTTVGFDVDTASGSGSYSYNWSFGGNSFTTKSFSLDLNYDYYGTGTAFCTVTDNITGRTETVQKQIIVNGAPVLKGKQAIVQVFNNNDIEYSARIGIANLNGSGQYAYEWTIDGQDITGDPEEVNIYMDCSDTSTTVVCKVTDTLTNNDVTITRTYSFRGNCSGNGGGPGGGGNNNNHQ